MEPSELIKSDHFKDNLKDYYLFFQNQTIVGFCKPNDLDNRKEAVKTIINPDPILYVKVGDDIFYELKR